MLLLQVSIIFNTSHTDLKVTAYYLQNETWDMKWCSLGKVDLTSDNTSSVSDKVSDILSEYGIRYFYESNLFSFCDLPFIYLSDTFIRYF